MSNPATTATTIETFLTFVSHLSARYGIELRPGYIGNVETTASGTSDYRRWSVWVPGIKIAGRMMTIGSYATESLGDFLKDAAAGRIEKEIAYAVSRPDLFRFVDSLDSHLEVAATALDAQRGALRVYQAVSEGRNLG